MYLESSVTAAEGDSKVNLAACSRADNPMNTYIAVNTCTCGETQKLSTTPSLLSSSSSVLGETSPNTSCSMVSRQLQHSELLLCC